MSTATRKPSSFRSSPTAASRRRLTGSRLTSRRLAAAQPTVIIRAPLVLYVSADLRWIRAGTAGEALPRRLVHVNPLLTNDGAIVNSAAEYYRVLAPAIPEAFELLDGGGGDPQQQRRRVLVFLTQMPSMSLKEALSRILMSDIGVPAWAVATVVPMIPFAVPVRSGIVVYATSTTKAQYSYHCLAFSHGHSLEFTYQVSTESPVNALVHCLQTAPISTRRACVGNLVFANDVSTVKVDSADADKIDPAFVTRELRRVLTAGSFAPTSQSGDNNEQPVETTKEDELVMATAYPVAWSRLKPLAQFVGYVDMPVGGHALPWMGVSLWSKHWHEINPDAPQFAWTKAAKV